MQRKDYDTERPCEDWAATERTATATLLSRLEEVPTRGRVDWSVGYESVIDKKLSSD